MSGNAEPWDLCKEVEGLKALREMMGWDSEDDDWKAKRAELAKKDSEMKATRVPPAAVPAEVKEPAQPQVVNKGKRKAADADVKPDVKKKARDQVPWGVLESFGVVEAENFLEVQKEWLPQIFGHEFKQCWTSPSGFMYNLDPVRRYRPQDAAPGDESGLLLIVKYN